MGEVTLTGGVEAAFTTKETFLEDGAGRPPRICLVASAEEQMEEEETNAISTIDLTPRLHCKF